MDKLGNWDVKYVSSLPIEKCIRSIVYGSNVVSEPWSPLRPRITSYPAIRYKAKQISPSKVLIKFLGGFGQRFKNTQYYMDFYTENDKTVILMRFHKELAFFIKMWAPCTDIYDIDMCIAMRMSGKRIETGAFFQKT